MSWSRKTMAAGFGLGAALVVRRLWHDAALKRKNRAIPRGTKIVVLGAGFAGMSTARELARLLPDDAHGEITLIDENNFLLFTPMLTEVAGGELDPRHIVVSPHRLSPRVRFEKGRVHDIDLANRSVVLNVGDDESTRRTVKADHLVIALGSTSDFHHIPGVREHSLEIKDLAGAVTIRNRVLACLETANGENDPAIRQGLLTFVTGGGGYTGVETMAAINDLARSAAKDYPNIDPHEIRTIIVEPGERLLAELSADLAGFAQAELQKRGVEVLLRTKITKAEEDHIEAGERSIPARTLVWAGGISPNPLIETLDCERGRHGGIVVDECCALPGRPGVWAIGDCAEIPKSRSQGTYAPTGQNATREGAWVARNVVAVLREEAPRPFRFQPIGELALVGRHSAVAKIYGRHFSGMTAWAIWRAVYVAEIPGFAHRSRIVADWILDAIFGRNVAEFPAGMIGR